MRGKNSPLFEIARVLVRFDHVARRIVNANHGNGRVNPNTRSLQCRIRPRTLYHFRFFIKGDNSPLMRLDGGNNLMER